MLGFDSLLTKVKATYPGDLRPLTCELLDFDSLLTKVKATFPATSAHSREAIGSSSQYLCIQNEILSSLVDVLYNLPGEYGNNSILSGPMAFFLRPSINGTPTSNSHVLI